MLSQLIISPNLNQQKKQVDKLLNKLVKPDLLILETEQKSWGIEDIKKLKDHFFLSGPKVVVLYQAERLTPEAQNSLLKILEEPPIEGSIILTADSEASLLPALLSRCQIVQLPTEIQTSDDWTEIIERLIQSNLPDRISQLEEIEDKDGLLQGFNQYFNQKLVDHPQSLEQAKLVMDVNRLVDTNISLKGALEYLLISL